MEHEDFVTYEQAVQLKELGFDWKTHTFYTKESDLYSSGYPDYWNDEIWDEFSAPSLAQAQKWLREVKGKIIIPCVMHIENIMKYDFYIADEPLDVEYDFEGFDTYEQALSAGINKALEELLKSL